MYDKNFNDRCALPQFKILALDGVDSDKYKQAWS